MIKKHVLAFAMVLLAPAFCFGAPLGNIKLDSKVQSMQKAGVGPVMYPHGKHEKIFKCNECHPKIFKEKHGENNISMKMNMEGKYCGSANCHNSPNAFPLFECHRCHTKAGAK